MYPITAPAWSRVGSRKGFEVVCLGMKKRISEGAQAKPVIEGGVGKEACTPFQMCKASGRPILTSSEVCFLHSSPGVAIILYNTSRSPPWSGRRGSARASEGTVTLGSLQAGVSLFAVAKARPYYSFVSFRTNLGSRPGGRLG